MNKQKSKGWKIRCVIKNLIGIVGCLGFCGIGIAIYVGTLVQVKLILVYFLGQKISH